jgi:hypothetical protein
VASGRQPKEMSHEAPGRAGEGRRRLARRLGILVGCCSACAAPLAAGCGASSAIDPVAVAAETTEALPGAVVDFSGEVISPGTAETVVISGTGRTSSRPPEAQASFEFRASGASSRHPGLSLEMRVVHDVLFLQLPQKSAMNGKHWVKVDERATSKAAGLGSLQPSGEVDPSETLAYLRAVSGALTNLGPQVIHGVPTTGFRGEIDLERVAERTPAARRARTVAAIANLEHLTGVSTVPFQVWIDASHRVRRLSMVEGESSTLPNAAKVYLTEDFVRFGPVRKVAPPPSGDVFDASAAASGLSRANLRAAHR